MAISEALKKAPVACEATEEFFSLRSQRTRSMSLCTIAR
jgi:hypothetical protein